jgi:hypothetical protein
MGVLILSEERHLRLCHFRRNAWKAVLLCTALRLADTTLGLGLVEPTTTTVAYEAHREPAAVRRAD